MPTFVISGKRENVGQNNLRRKRPDVDVLSRGGKEV